MNFLLKNCRIVNNGAVVAGDVRVRAGRIAAVGGELTARRGESVEDGGGDLLFPGLIDDQVHFRQPGLTSKATIRTESRAAVAGGVTSYMEMPNVRPPTLTMELIEKKRAIAARHSRGNYAFYLGASADNIADIAAANPRRIAGVKIFMGASTGNLLVDDDKTLNAVFAAAPTIIAVHCESTPRINRRLRDMQKRCGNKPIPPQAHPRIRDAAVCYESSSRAVALARHHGARLHVLHISTARELSLFSASKKPLAKKQITCEACVHHLLFCDDDYEWLGMRLKTNPAVKSKKDRAALRQAVREGVIDVLATDHAPHLLHEKDLPYAQAAAGMPLVEYALPAFLEIVADGDLTYPQIAQRGAHAVADLFNIKDRGYLHEGYWADMVLVKETLLGELPRRRPLAKCGWTPFTHRRFRHTVRAAYVNGEKVWDGKKINDSVRGRALEFLR